MPLKAAPIERRRLDQIEAEIAAAERQIADEDQRIIIALHKGRDITAAEDKVGDTRVILEGMKAMRRKLLG